MNYTEYLNYRFESEKQYLVFFEIESIRLSNEKDYFIGFCIYNDQLTVVIVNIEEYEFTKFKEDFVDEPYFMFIKLLDVEGKAVVHKYLGKTPFSEDENKNFIDKLLSSELYECE